MTDAAPEFSMIARHFRPLAGPGALNLLDDAALLTPPPGQQLVLAADAMVAGVHFLPEDPPETIGRKLLRVNLSDLAAMGAEPLGYLMTIALAPGMDEAWLAGFTAGLAEDQRAFGLHVLGGDTVSTPGPLSLSLTILGHAPPGAALTRAGARPGDDLWVSGRIGDGWLGLRAARGEIADPDGALARRYRLPEPRLALGLALRGLARACMDVSDGLLQDAGHLARAGGCAVAVEAARIPVSDATAPIAALASGGDDYELLFASAPEDRAAVEAAGLAARTPVTRLGRFTGGAPRVTLRDSQGQDITPARLGWSHL
ncbi:thiamine-phosphate kinase [Roseococcus sp. SDR]|uniref:thiamine-phosphate kinase n=1 Tax=Roseococcus sp. SDR TaxID=2835532 RepID=UPI001BD1AAFB|nr:thiamine-phosphate kinase [Roseococcus sp. SDR]MBS7792124.1 thiamine-phosphate kinase [Roseococcus sp. SDR]MBV1847438.1 thiamine-phosphate kinase [Roseococcus sp. SDR]